MAKNRGKTLIINTFLLIICGVIVALYCLNPIKETEPVLHLMSFDVDGGTAIKALEFPECTKLEEPSNPTREGYIFGGWTLNGEPFDFSEEVCGDIELKAIWEEQKPEVKYITIYISNGDGSPNSPVVIEEGTIPARPSDPTRDGYKFTGWKYNGNNYNFDTPLSDGAVITASWEKVEEEKPEDPEKPEEDEEFTVKFNLNGGVAGGTCTDQKVKKNAIAKNICRPTRSGFTLTGWSPAIGTKITKNTTFIAQWKQNTTPSGGGGGGENNGPFTINFNTNGGSGCGSVTLPLNKTFVISQKCPTTKRHYHIHHWTFNGTTYQHGSTFTVKQSGLLKATWEINKFYVSCVVIKDNGYDTPNCKITVKEGNTVIASGFTIYYAPNKPLPKLTVNTANDWPKLTNLTMDYDGITGIPLIRQ